MVSIHGPHPISSKLQVRLPAKLAKQLSIEAGDEFYWRASDDEPGVLMLLPVEVVERRYSAGERLERAALEVARELDQSGARAGEVT
jgi:antitoxin component of MazEF toxin-antitoxin module